MVKRHCKPAGHNSFSICSVGWRIFFQQRHHNCVRGSSLTGCLYRNVYEVYLMPENTLLVELILIHHYEVPAKR